VAARLLGRAIRFLQRIGCLLLQLGIADPPTVRDRNIDPRSRPGIASTSCDNQYAVRRVLAALGSHPKGQFARERLNWCSMLLMLSLQVITRTSTGLFAGGGGGWLSTSEIEQPAHRLRRLGYSPLRQRRKIVHFTGPALARLTNDLGDAAENQGSPGRIPTRNDPLVERARIAGRSGGSWQRGEYHEWIIHSAAAMSIDRIA